MTGSLNNIDFTICRSKMRMVMTDERTDLILVIDSLP
jgi:hypothetical protein